MQLSSNEIKESCASKRLELAEQLRRLRLPSGTHPTLIDGLWATTGIESLPQRAPFSCGLFIAVEQPFRCVFEREELLTFGAVFQDHRPPHIRLEADSMRTAYLWLRLEPHELLSLRTVDPCGPMQRPTAARWEALLRLLGAASSEGDLKVLAPLYRQECCFRWLRHSTTFWPQTPHHRSTRQSLQSAVFWLEKNFREPLEVCRLASMAFMSPSSFHRHFRRLTGQSPLQFQKAARLREAQRLMLEEKRSASEAAYLVGYASASHFNRDYVRQFGVSPAKDAAMKLRTIRAIGSQNGGPAAASATQTPA